MTKWCYCAVNSCEQSFVSISSINFVSSECGALFCKEKHVIAALAMMKCPACSWIVCVIRKYILHCLRLRVKNSKLCTKCLWIVDIHENSAIIKHAVNILLCRWRICVHNDGSVFSQYHNVAVRLLA